MNSSIHLTALKIQRESRGRLTYCDALRELSRRSAAARANARRNAPPRFGIMPIPERDDSADSIESPRNFFNR
jgi:hypothetical protein